MKTIGPNQFAELLERHDPTGASGVLTITDAQIDGLSLLARDLSSCVLVRCRLTDAFLDRCDLSAAQFFNSRFERCRLIDCNLRKAEFNDADVRGVDFTRSEMSRCDLTGADLRGANLTDCVLDWAWLVKCDLRDAVLDRASFRGTRIGAAKLHNARRFALGPHDQARVDNADLSAAGDGSVIVNGDELWARLSAPDRDVPH